MAVDPNYEHTARFFDPAYADHPMLAGSTEFYLALARETGGPVLEMGCGTGRILLPVAQAGIECAGLDPSPAMLDVLRSKPGAEKIELHCAAMQAFDLGAHRFQMVFSGFRAFQHLETVDEQLACLTLVRAHLAPGGVFAMDVFNPRLERLVQDLEPESVDLEFTMGERRIRRFATIRRNRATQVTDITMRYVEEEGETAAAETTVHFTMRWIHPYELEHLLYRAGFAEVEIFGGFDRSPRDRDSKDLVVTAR